MMVWTGGLGPQESATFDIDWTARLAGQTISVSDWSLVDGEDTALVLGAKSFTSTPTSTRTQITLSGGTYGSPYVLQNTVTLTTGETLTEKVMLPMKDR